MAETMTPDERANLIQDLAERMANAKTLAGKQQCWRFIRMLTKGRVIDIKVRDCLCENKELGKVSTLQKQTATLDKITS